MAWCSVKAQGQLYLYITFVTMLTRGPSVETLTKGWIAVILMRPLWLLELEMFVLQSEVVK
jgi:hypothetical protein